MINWAVTSIDLTEEASQYIRLSVNGFDQSISALAITGGDAHIGSYDFVISAFFPDG